MEAINRNIDSLDIITVILVLSLFLITFVRFVHSSRFFTYLILPVNNKYVTIYNKKGKISSWFHLGNSMFQLLNFSVYAHFTAKTLGLIPKVENLSIFLVFGLGLLLFLMAKMLLQLGAGFVFDIQVKITELIFNKQSYFNYSAFIAFLANIFLAYITPSSKIVVYLSLALITLINILCFYSLFKVNQNLIQNRFVYFILYLCALEIAPLVIFGSYLKG